MIKKINLNVTANDIAKGKKHECDKCPIARALSRHFAVVSVSQSRIYCWDKDNKLYETLTPFELKTFINNFDDDKTVEPFKFELVVRQSQ